VSNEVEIVVRSKNQSGPGIEAAKQGLRGLKREAESIRDVKVDVDVDIAAALAELGVFRDAAGRLRETNGRFVMDADVKRAVAEIEGVEEEIRRVDGKKANVNVDADVGAALAKIALVGAALAGLSVGAAGIGIAGAVGAAGAVGFGAIAAGLSGIGDAVGAMGQKVGGAGGAAASTAKSVRNANEEITRAKEGVVRADRDLEAAHRGVERAERDLSHAQREAKDAQNQLNDAREQAAEDLQSLTDQVADNALAQRRAILSVEDARNKLANVMADRTATETQRQEAQLTYDEAVQQQTDLSHKVQQVSEDQAEAAKKGVEGSDKVVQAHQRQDDALQKVKDSQQGVRDAILKVTEAQENLADANRSVADAQRKAGEAGQSAGSAGAGGVNKLAQAMANLSPAGQRFARFMYGFINGPLKELRFAAQDGLLPPLQAALEKLGPVIHKISPAFEAFSNSLGKGLGGAIGFVGQLAPSFLKFATVAMQGLSPLGGVLSRFSTLFGQMVDKVTKNGSLKAAMDGLVKIVAALTDNLPGLIQVGLGLAAALGPALADTLRALIPLAVAIAKALGPTLVSAIESVLPLITSLTDWINNNQGLFSDLVVTVLAVVAAVKVWTIVQGIFNLVMDANPVMLVILAVAALVVMIVLAYRHSETFRNIVQIAGKVAAASFQWVLTKVQQVFGWMKHNWPLLLAILTGPIGIAVLLIVRNWGRITGAVQGAWNTVRRLGSSMWDSVKNAATSAVRWVTDKFNGLMNFVSGIKDRIGGVLDAVTPDHFPTGFASGGISHAAEGGPRSNLAMVGEHGRELVRLPFGSSVMTNGATEGLLGGGGGSSGPIHIFLQIGDTALGELIVDPLRKAVRTRGGNVQAVLGR
jgi:phage-related protein